MSDQTPEQAPRPQYGEYATPEEQRARIRQPDIEAALAGQATVAEPPVAAPVALPTASSTPAGAGAAVGADVPPSSRRRIDRIVTVALLAYGLVSVVTSIPALVDYSTYADTVFQLLGVDATISDPAAARPWGIAAAIVLALGWAITALLSWWSLRRGRVTWWIPLVGALVFTMASSVLMMVPLMSDPAVWDAIAGSVR